ncbi:MAG: spermidine/putrescine ABC transporter substrate-binding protein [Clostridia bacterium]|nr:spermidine/putrescine ABC transporter substrate-binding protein [Clostridia bacterium]
MKKTVAIALILCAVFALFPVSSFAASDSVPLTGEVINVYNWGLYISDGTDGTLDVNAEFTRRTGIQVNYSTYEDNESLYTKLKTGGSSYDIIIPSDYMIAKLIEEDMLEKLNFENIPNYKYIDESFKNTDYDPTNEYSVPYTWGTVGIIYNTKYVDPIDSWSALWDERYSDKILMFGNSRDAFAISAFLLGLSINSTDEGEIRQMADKLAEQKPFVQQYVMDQSYSQMINEEAWLVPYYAGDYLVMAEENPDLAFCHPKEGFNVFIDAICIPKSAQNKSAAEKYINFLCDPEISGGNMDAIGYSTPISEAKQYMDPETASSAIAYPDEETLERAVSFTNLPTETIRQMNSLWTSIKSGNGLPWYLFVIVGVAIAAAAIFIVIRKKKRNSY